MTPLNHLAAVCCCAGMLGALVGSFAFWLAGTLGGGAWGGFDPPSAFTLAWLYPRLAWGGLWGLLLTLFFATPRRRRSWIRKGLWFSLLPSAAHLLYLFPQTSGPGFLGLILAGTFTPLLFLPYNALWGACTAIFIRLLWGRG